MKVTLCGAAGEVTGSCYLVQTDRATVLVDCGMFQGQGATEARNRSLEKQNADLRYRLYGTPHKEGLAA